MADFTSLEVELQRLRTQLFQAATAQEFKQIGHASRELLISIAQSVFDSAKHRLPDGRLLSPTDAKGILEAFVAEELPGAGNEEARRYCRAAVDLANAVQHDRAATFQDAAIAVESCAGVLAVVGILAGQRLIPGSPWEGFRQGSRYFAWDGPTLHALQDRSPIPLPPDLIDALKALGWIPRFGTTAKLAHYLSRGLLQVWETDRSSWRRAILMPGGGDQILLIGKDAA